MEDWEWEFHNRRALTGDYRQFDREGYIEATLAHGRPVVITWVPNWQKLECRRYQDVYGMSDILGIEELHTLFDNDRHYRAYLIPYMITGYAVPPILEQDEEPLVPFTASTITKMMEIDQVGELEKRVADATKE